MTKAETAKLRKIIEDARDQLGPETLDDLIAALERFVATHGKDGK